MIGGVGGILRCAQMVPSDEGAVRNRAPSRAAIVAPIDRILQHDTKEYDPSATSSHRAGFSAMLGTNLAWIWVVLGEACLRQFFPGLVGVCLVLLDPWSEE